MGLCYEQSWAQHIPSPPDTIGALCLLPSHQDLLPGTPCWVSGWGYTGPDQRKRCPCSLLALPVLCVRFCHCFSLLLKPHEFLSVSSSS